MITLNTIAATSISTATGAATQQFAAIVNEKLCRKVCINQSIQPTAHITYSVGSVTSNGNDTFVKLVATGHIDYVPKGGCACSTIQQSFTEYTMLVFNNSATTATPAITISQNETEGFLTNFDCLNGRNYEIATDILVTATY